MASIYEQRGFDNREDYLEEVADQYGVDYSSVQAVAELLGENEDFDGLLSECADIAGCPVMEVSR